MNSSEIKYYITALADNEITDDNIRSELIEKIASDKSLRFDYSVQLGMKKLLSAMKKCKTPEEVKQQIIKKITPPGPFLFNN